MIIYGLRIQYIVNAVRYFVLQLLTKLNLHEIYTGNDDINGEDYHVEDINGSPDAFRCLLDVGVARTGTGAPLFGALKGARDGGLDIPHRLVPHLYLKIRPLHSTACLEIIKSNVQHC